MARNYDLVQVTSGRSSSAALRISGSDRLETPRLMLSAPGLTVLRPACEAFDGARVDSDPDVDFHTLLNVRLPGNTSIAGGQCGHPPDCKSACSRRLRESEYASEVGRTP